VEIGAVNIQGNTILSFMETGDGIEITGSGVAQVVGNTISSCGQNGIYLNYSETNPPSHIVGNTIRFNAFGIAGGIGCPLGIVSSNILLQNGQDITYIAPT
jgi:parallel beta-helix repeat protein